jgi:hypothetical protein
MGVQRQQLRFGVVAAGAMAFTLAATSAAWGCGGLVAPNGAVDLERATTLAAYVDGVEHYVTAFEFSDVNSDFGAIVPLPGVPTSVKKAGDWTLQRLVQEVTPPPPLAESGSAGALASPRKAQVLLQTRVDALDITVLSGGGPAVVRWVKAHGYEVSDDAPAMLTFYAKRSPVFLAAKFDPAEAIKRGVRSGDSTPIQIAIPTPNPWVPLRILGMAMEDDPFVNADLFLLTPRKPALLTGRGVNLKRSEAASPLLLRDLRSDKRMGWMPATGLWFSYLRLHTPPDRLTYDLAIDTTGDNHPSPMAAALPAAFAKGPVVDLGNEPSHVRWIAIGAVGAVVICSLIGVAVAPLRRRTFAA